MSDPQHTALCDTCGKPYATFGELAPTPCPASAEAARLRKALEACDVVMDTAASHGLEQLLPPAYRDSWAAAHSAARAELAKARTP